MKKMQHNLSKAENPQKESRIFRMCRHPMFAPGLVILLGLCLRLPNFTASLWYDEVWYTHAGLQGSHFMKVLFHDVHPPLYPLLMRGWICLFDDGEISMRMPSLIFGLASIWLIYALAKNWFGRMTAVLAALLMALSPFHIWYSQEAKNNMLLLLLTLLALWGLQQAWKTDKRSCWCLFILASIFSLWTNHFALWAITATLVWLWLQLLAVENRLRFGRIIGSTVIILLSYLPALLLMLLQKESLVRGYLRSFTPLEVYNLFLIYLSHGNTLRTVFPWSILKSIQNQPGWFFFLEIFFLVLLTQGAWSIGRSYRARIKEGKKVSGTDAAGSEVLLFYLTAPPVLLLAASLFRPHIYVERSMIFLLPPYLILLAHGALSFRSIKLQAMNAGLLLVLSVISLYNLWGPKDEAWTVWMPKPDWRAVASFFDAEISAGNERFIIFHVTPETSLDYYYERILKSGNAESSPGRPARLPTRYMKKFIRDEFDEYLSATDLQNVYLIHNHQWSGGFAGVMSAVMADPRLRMVDRKRFSGITVYKFAVF